MMKFLILLISSLILCSPTYAHRIVDEINKTRCKELQCEVFISEKSHRIAYTTMSNDIIITKGMLNYLSDNEIRSVLYHELAHVKLQHSKKLLEEVYKRYPHNTSKDLKTFRHIQEYSADITASQMLKEDNKPNKLSQALIKILKLKQSDINSDTHPPIKQRIYVINTWIKLNSKE